jgi:hypothetical protein
MSILSDRNLNKVSPAAQKDKVKMKRLVVFTDEDTPGIRGANVTSSNLTDYARKNTVKVKYGTGYDTGKRKNIIKVPKSEYKKENPIFKDTKSSEGYFVPTTPRDTKRLTKYNRRIGARFVSKEKAADKIDKTIDRVENDAKRGNPWNKQLVNK